MDDFHLMVKLLSIRFIVASTINLQVQRTTLCVNLDGITDMKIIVTEHFSTLQVPGVVRVLHVMHRAGFSLV